MNLLWSHGVAVGRSSKGWSILVALSLGLLAFGVYARTVGSYFLCEDFVLIRLLSTSPWYQGFVSTWYWPDVQGAQFYRPMSSLVLFLASQSFGPGPLGYHMLGLCVHALNGVLVMVCANSLTDRKNVRIGYVAGLLFIIYPLHPAAVSYVAAYSSVFLVCFMLLSLLAFMHYRESGSTAYFLLSLTAFVLALGSHENAVVYPALLVSADWLKGGGRLLNRGLKEWVRLYVPYVLVLIAFLFVKKLAVGALFVGAALDLLDPFAAGIERIRSYPRILAKVVYPVFGDDPMERSARVLFLLCVVGCAAVFFKRLVVRRENIAMGVFSLVWVVLATSLYGLIDGPYQGRQWYLASVGMSIGLSFFVVQSLSWCVLRGRQVLSIALLIIVVFCYMRLLNQALVARDEAGTLAQAVQQQLVALDAYTGGDTTWFFGNYPLLLRKKGSTFFEVFKYGLVDSVGPPFTDRKVRVYPLGEVVDAEAVRDIISEEKMDVLTWDEKAQQIKRVSLPNPRTEEHGAPYWIEVLYPQEDAALPAVEGHLWFAFRSFNHDRFRVVLATPGGALTYAVRSAETMKLNGQFQGLLNRDVLDRVEAGVPGKDFVVQVLLPYVDVLAVKNAVTLYRGPFFWWVEARDQRGEVIAHSAMKSFRVVR